MLLNLRALRAPAPIALVACAIVSPFMRTAGDRKAQDLARDLRMTLELRRTMVRPSDSVIVQVILENETNSPIHAIAPMEWPIAFLSVFITRSDGYSLEGHGFRYPDTFVAAYASRWEVTVPPRGFVGRFLTIANSRDTSQAGFSLDRAGDYAVCGTMYVRSVKPPYQVVVLWSDTVIVHVR